MRYCSQCGTALSDEAIFCNNCGATTNEQSPPAASPVATNMATLLNSLSQKLQTNGIIWLVIGILQVLGGVCFGFNEFLMIVGVLNIFSSINDMKYSKALLANPTEIVKHFEPLTGPIITLVYNLVLGGVIGVVGSIYYLVAIRSFVMENKVAFSNLTEMPQQEKVRTVKSCPHCGKELPEEMQFCPYCMEKFVKETPVSAPTQKPRRRWWLWLIVVAVVLLLGLLAWFLWPTDTSIDTDTNTPTATDTDTETNSTSDTTPTLGKSYLALPLDLSFGVSTDTFSTKLAENKLTVDPANISDYSMEFIELPLDNPAMWEFTGSETLKRLAAEDYDAATEYDLYWQNLQYELTLPKLGAFFNQNKAMYEIYVTWFRPSEDILKQLTVDLTLTYNDYFGTVGMSVDSGIQWEDERYIVSFIKESGVFQGVDLGDTYRLTIHDKTYYTKPQNEAGDGDQDGTTTNTTTKTTADKTAASETTSTTTENASVTSAATKTTSPTKQTTEKQSTTTKQTTKQTATTKQTTSTAPVNNDPCANGHAWTELWETVHHEEVGHYEEQETDAIRITVYKCALCYEKHESLDDYYTHFDTEHADTDSHIHVFRDRYETDTEFRSVYGQVWVVDQEAWDEDVLTGYACRRCGEEKNP